MLGDRFFLRVGVPAEKLEECYQWAFGDDYVSLLCADLGDRWCERHGDLFVVKDATLISEAFPKIGKAFLEAIK